MQPDTDHYFAILAVDHTSFFDLTPFLDYAIILVTVMQTM